MLGECKTAAGVKVCPAKEKLLTTGQPAQAIPRLIEVRWPVRLLSLAHYDDIDRRSCRSGFTPDAPEKQSGISPDLQSNGVIRLNETQ